MQQLKVTLEAVTPLFLGGSDYRTPELRPPPFRGLMRYWWRALAGGVVGDRNEALKTIWQKEGEVFGSPNEKTGGQSAVWVRLSTPNYDRNYKTRVLPHRNDEFTNHQGKTLKNYPQYAIPPGVTPTLTLTLKPNAGIKKLEIAAWSLLAGLMLGGIGKRSRRGFGSLRVASVDKLPSELDDALREQLEQATQLPANGEELATRIRGLLTTARNAFTTFLGNPTPHFNDPPLFSMLKPDTPIVVWTPGEALPENENYNHSVLAPLMSKLSSKMAEMEKKKKGSFAEAFGGINIRLPNTRDRFRRASPLWVSTHRLQNNGWALVLTHLKAKYLPKHAGNKHHLVTDFLNSSPEGWTKTEVQR